MQPLSTSDKGGRLLITTKKHATVPVNKEAFWKMEGEKIGADEVFFHKYFNTKAIGLESAKRKKVDKKSKKDSEDESYSENEDEIWKALVDSRPELEGSEEGDDDVDMGNLDSAMDDSDGGAALRQDDTTSIEKFDSFSDEGLDLEDEDALLDTDDEVQGQFDPKASGKEMSTKEKTRERRRMLKNLPTFASADEYANLMQNDESDEGDF